MPAARTRYVKAAFQVHVFVVNVVVLQSGLHRPVYPQLDVVLRFPGPADAAAQRPRHVVAQVLRLSHLQAEAAAQEVNLRPVDGLVEVDVPLARTVAAGCRRLVLSREACAGRELGEHVLEVERRAHDDLFCRLRVSSPVDHRTHVAAGEDVVLHGGHQLVAHLWHEFLGYVLPQTDDVERVDKTGDIAPPRLLLHAHGVGRVLVLGLMEGYAVDQLKGNAEDGVGSPYLLHYGHAVEVALQVVIAPLHAVDHVVEEWHHRAVVHVDVERIGRLGSGVQATHQHHCRECQLSEVVACVHFFRIL